MIAGVILCGGASQRMGRDKAQLDFLGETLLARMIRIVQSVCQPIVIAGGPQQSILNIPDGVVISRDVALHQGPIQGLRAALQVLPADAHHAFVVGCDTPLLRPDVIRFLHSRSENGKAVVAKIDGFLQPLPAVYPVRETLANSSAHSLMDLLRQLPVEVIPESDLQSIDPFLDSFQPMNTPEEWQAAIHRANS